MASREFGGLEKQLEAALKKLRSEREALERQIESVEGALGALRGTGARTSRSKAAGRKKPNWSPEAREAARKRMRQYWAERKKSGSARSPKKK